MTVAGLDATWPSNAVYVNVSVPVKPAAGVYVILLPAAAESEPCAGGDAAANVSASPSTSVATSAIETAVPSNVCAATGSATGASLTSLIVYVNASAPL